MKVTHSSQDKLIIDNTPWLLSIGLICLILLFVGIGLVPIAFSNELASWFFAFMFIVVGGGLWLMALELFARRLQFVFERSTDRVSIRRKSVFTDKVINHKLSRLEEARIQQSFSDNGQPMQRPVLILRSKSADKKVRRTVPLHSYYTSGSGPETVCEAINTWLSEAS
jgi:hypothetical protein